MSKTALLFAGQGANAVGMGKDLAAAYPSAKAWFDRANSALGYDLTAICFSGPDAVLTRTENAQPGIFLISWVAFQLLKEKVPSLQFQATAGLSLGEFTALTAAGVMGFEDALRVVRQRGRFMQEACAATQGGMAAIIGLSEAATREVCAETGVVLANLNCPGQLVISGATEKMAPACALADRNHPVDAGTFAARIVRLIAENDYADAWVFLHPLHRRAAPLERYVQCETSRRFELGSEAFEQFVSDALWFA